MPELQETLKPHPHFMLWGTQNPPGAYGGRKQLSRAFRTRFLELHVGEFPEGELAQILHQRCSIAPSYAAKMVAVMRDLERRRQVRTQGQWEDDGEAAVGFEDQMMTSLSAGNMHAPLRCVCRSGNAGHGIGPGAQAPGVLML